MQEFFLDDVYRVAERHDDVAEIDYTNERIEANLKKISELSPVDQ